MKTLNEKPLSTNSSKRKLDNSDDDDDDDIGHTVKQPNTDKGIFSTFLVIASLNETKPITKISPFILQKSIQACAGEVKKVTKMKNGCLLVECIRQQSKNLLSLTSIADLQISVTPHRKLNSCQGVIRDRDHDLTELSEEQICEELKNQHVSKVKRFTKKSDNTVVKLHTYLLTFELSTAGTYLHWTLQNKSERLRPESYPLLQMSKVWAR